VTALRRAAWCAVPLGIFLTTRLASGFLIVVLARHQIPASALPADMPLPTLESPATYLHVIANWDGQWYRQIAMHGYPSRLPVEDGAVQQNAWAFYPLFPALAWLGMKAGLSFGIAASVISLGAGALAMCLLYRMLMPRTGRFTAGLTVLALCSAPAAPIWQASYTESLGLLLVLVALWALQERRYATLVVAGLGLALARGIAPALAVVVVLEYLRLRRSSEPTSSREQRPILLCGIAIAAASLLWPAITAVVTGRADAYWSTQKAWITVAGNNTDSWLVSLLRQPAQVTVVVGALAVLAYVCLRARSWPLVLRVWPVPYAVFILAVTPATASVLRFSLLLGAPWWPAPEWSRRLYSPVGRWFVVVGVFALGLLLQWWWLERYFVIDPGSHGHP
jgi:hypothetical protein